jgi:hypothetical protein
MRLSAHHCLRDISFTIEDGAQFKEHINKRRIMNCGLAYKAGEPNRGVLPNQFVTVFEGDWETEKGGSGRSGCAFRALSRERALSIASSKKISVKQLTWK